MRSRRSPQLPDPEPAPSTLASRLGAVLGASAAALVSAALVYWIGSGGDPTLKRAGQAPPVPAYASPQADPAQVVRAFEQLQEIYAGRGAAGVADFARGCARSLGSDPGALDFCVAFDIFAASLIGDDAMERAWRANADQRDLELARAALAPGDDPIVRLARIRELARQTSLRSPDLTAQHSKTASKLHRAKPRHVWPVAKPTPELEFPRVAAAAGEPASQASSESAAQTAAPPPPAPAPAAAPSPLAQLLTEPGAGLPGQPAIQPPAVATAEAKPRAKPTPVKKAAVRKASSRRERASASGEACSRKVTAGERTVCASPALREADAQLQSAYRKAVAAGASPKQLAREQARFKRAVNAAAPDRVAVERLYYQRTRTLEALSESP